MQEDYKDVFGEYPRKKFNEHDDDEILVPTFEYGVNPTIKISEVKARRFSLIDREQITPKEIKK